MTREQMENYIKEQLEDMSAKLMEYIKENDIHTVQERPGLTMAIYPYDGYAWAYMLDNPGESPLEKDLRYVLDVTVNLEEEDGFTEEELNG